MIIYDVLYYTILYQTAIIGEFQDFKTDIVDYVKE